MVGGLHKTCYKNDSKATLPLCKWTACSRAGTPLAQGHVVDRKNACGHTFLDCRLMTSLPCLWP